MRRAGYRFAFTNQAGVWTRDSDPLLIPRVNIWEGKLVGLSGSFSAIAFEYATFWKAYRAEKCEKALQQDQGRAMGAGSLQLKANEDDISSRHGMSLHERPGASGIAEGRASAERGI